VRWRTCRDSPSVRHSDGLVSLSPQFEGPIVGTGSETVLEAWLYGEPSSDRPSTVRTGRHKALKRVSISELQRIQRQVWQHASYCCRLCVAWGSQGCQWQVLFSSRVHHPCVLSAQAVILEKDYAYASLSAKIRMWHVLVVTVCAVGTSRYIQFPWCGGGDLGKWLQQGLPISQAIPLLREVLRVRGRVGAVSGSLSVVDDKSPCLQGVVHLHELDIVLGNLRPSDVLLDENSHPRISNWGADVRSTNPPELSPRSTTESLAHEVTSREPLSFASDMCVMLLCMVGARFCSLIHRVVGLADMPSAAFWMSLPPRVPAMVRAKWLLCPNYG